MSASPSQVASTDQGSGDLEAAYTKLENLIPKDEVTYVEVSMVLKDKQGTVVGRVSYAKHQPSMFMTIFLGTFASSVVAVNISLIILLIILAILRARWKKKWAQLKEWMTKRSLEVKEFVKKQKGNTNRSPHSFITQRQRKESEKTFRTPTGPPSRSYR